MNWLKITLSGIAGSAVYFLLGWVAYDLLFKSFFPDDGQVNLLYIYFGCLFYTLMLAFILIEWAKITSWNAALIGGGFIGFMTALSMNFFNYSHKVLDVSKISLNVAITTCMSAIVGISIVCLFNCCLSKCCTKA